MSEMKLVDRFDPILHTKLETFDFANPPTDPIALYNDLGNAMLKYGGAGLAANQVGLPYRFFVIKANPIVGCFNPIIVDKSTETIDLDEGCLSFPGVALKVRRSRSIRIRYTEPNGNVVTHMWSGITARIALHEFDHLEGKTFLDHLSRVKREIVMKKALKGKTYSELEMAK